MVRGIFNRAVYHQPVVPVGAKKPIDIIHKVPHNPLFGRVLQLRMQEQQQKLGKVSAVNTTHDQVTPKSTNDHEPVEFSNDYGNAVATSSPLDRTTAEVIPTLDPKEHIESNPEKNDTYAGAKESSINMEKFLIGV